VQLHEVESGPGDGHGLGGIRDGESESGHARSLSQPARLSM
jgi:hypothetical protein